MNHTFANDQAYFESLRRRWKISALELDEKGDKAATLEKIFNQQAHDQKPIGFTASASFKWQGDIYRIGLTVAP